MSNECISDVYYPLVMNKKLEKHYFYFHLHVAFSFKGNEIKINVLKPAKPHQDIRYNAYFIWFIS